MGADKRNAPWTDEENDRIVADHFEMLHMELRGEDYVKSHRRRALQQQIQRIDSAIEYKHRNISAILEKLGLPTIQGYKSATNVQGKLVAAVTRRLEDPQGNTALLHAMEQAVRTNVAQLQPLLITHPPPLTAGTGIEEAGMLYLVQQFDPAERDSRNRVLGQAGEACVFHSERTTLLNHNRADLADKVEWTSKERGDGAGYDIRSYTPGGSERFLEVKTTLGHKTTPFYLTANERNYATQHPQSYRIFRLYDFMHTPRRAFTLQPPLESVVTLHPTAYRATFHTP